MSGLNYTLCEPVMHLKKGIAKTFLFFSEEHLQVALSVIVAWKWKRARFSGDFMLIPEIKGSENPLPSCTNKNSSREEWAPERERVVNPLRVLCDNIIFWEVTKRWQASSAGCVETSLFIQKSMCM
jgi:hypothetical protein